MNIRLLIVLIFTSPINCNLDLQVQYIQLKQSVLY